MQITWKIKYQTETFNDWFAGENICDNKAICKLCKNFLHGNKFNGYQKGNGMSWKQA